MATRKLTTALGLALVCQAALAVTEVRWTGGGSDTRMTTQGNWATPVTLTDGSLLAAFGNGGSAAGVVGQLYLNGVRFDSGSAFTVSAADASADLAIGDGGIAAAKAADYRISAPVRILADQTWELESVSGCKLTISGPLNAGQSPYTITIAGGGEDRRFRRRGLCRLGQHPGWQRSPLREGRLRFWRGNDLRSGEGCEPEWDYGREGLFL